MNSFAQRTKSMFASMALNAGIGTTTPMSNLLTGRPRSGIAALRELGVFNNDFDAYAPKNALGLRRMLRPAQGFR